MTQTPREDARLREIVGMGRQALQRLMNPAVPLRYKVIPLLALVYVVSPVDLIPDTVPVLTQLDDLAIAIVALRLFLSLTNDSTGAAESASDHPEPFEATYRVRED